MKGTWMFYSSQSERTRWAAYHRDLFEFKQSARQSYHINPVNEDDSHWHCGANRCTKKATIKVFIDDQSSRMYRFYCSYTHFAKEIAELDARKDED